MRSLAHMLSVLFAPRACWATIAAEGDTSRWLFRRYLPALVLATCLPALATNLAQDVARIWRTPEIGASLRVSLAPFEATFPSLIWPPLLAALALISTPVLRALVLWRAPRFGAAADRVAATRLVIHAATPACLALASVNHPRIGLPLIAAGAGLTLVLLYHGAPRLLPPAPGRAAAFGRSTALMAVMALPVILLLSVPAQHAVAGLLAVAVLAALVVASVFVPMVASAF